MSEPQSQIPAFKKPPRGNAISRMFAILKARPDSEHETTYNRIGIHILVTAHALLGDALGWFGDFSLLMHTGPYILTTFIISCGIFAHILYSPGENPARRYFSIVIDVYCITYAMHLGGEWFLWLYPFLLWAIFGNGFRFGVRYLAVGSAVSVVAFAWLLVYSPFWHRYPALSWGCLAGLITLPGYVSILIRKLSAAKRQAEESNRAKSAFLASISHELRTPLTAIIGLNDLLKTMSMDREQLDMIETIGDSGRSLLSLINAILDLSRLEVGKMPKKNQDIDLYRLLHRISDMVAVPAHAKNVRVQLAFAADVPRKINSSLKHLEDAIINLASNAVKFTEAGYVLIHVSAEASMAGRTKLRIEVEDSGIGIAESAQQRIFERFTQADETIIDKFGGTGLGLATVKQMIEDIGGDVEVRSKLGHGSTFSISLDVGVVKEEPARDWKDSEVIVVSDDLRLSQNLDALNADPQRVNSIVSAKELADRLWQDKHSEAIVIIDARSCGSDLDSVAEAFRSHMGETRQKLIALLDVAGDREFRASPLNYTAIVRRPIDLNALANSLVMAAGPRAANDGEYSVGPMLAAESHYSIIVADDNKVNLVVISKILTQAGHQVFTAENGVVAVEMMQARHFDVALFDINMPVMNGIDAAKLYRFTSHEERLAPIIALTADATPEAERRCLDAGMFACLTKPIEPHKLLHAVEKAVVQNGGRITEFEEVDAAPFATTNAFDPSKIVEVEAGNVIIDARAMDDLRDLGGPEFAQQVLEHFMTEASEALANIDQAVAAHDHMVFRDQVHALRSGAANVGAKRVFELCLLWRAIEPGELAMNGEAYVRELSEALVDCTNQLAAYCLAPMSAALSKGIARSSEAQNTQPQQRAS